jgi:hypothetical protein
VSTDNWLQEASNRCTSVADILTQLISRYSSSAAKDSSFADKRALRETIEEITNLRAECSRQTEIIITLRKELMQAKARNILYLSKIQEFEAREY